ncbi:MAG: hypothetical protein ACREFY_05205, partial [Acetobacteraceae bacterium]
MQSRRAIPAGPSFSSFSRRSSAESIVGLRLLYIPHALVAAMLLRQRSFKPDQRSSGITHSGASPRATRCTLSNAL